MKGKKGEGKEGKRKRKGMEGRNERRQEEGIKKDQRKGKKEEFEQKIR